MAALEPGLRHTAAELRRLVLDACPDFTESIKWGNPVYELSGKVCYLGATKAYVSLGFFNGAALHDPDGIIEGTGKKMRHVKVRDLNETARKQLTSYVKEAAELDR